MLRNEGNSGRDIYIAVCWIRADYHKAPIPDKNQNILLFVGTSFCTILQPRIPIFSGSVLGSNYGKHNTIRTRNYKQKNCMLFVDPFSHLLSVLWVFFPVGKGYTLFSCAIHAGKHAWVAAVLNRSGQKVVKAKVVVQHGRGTHNVKKEMWNEKDSRRNDKGHGRKLFCLKFRPAVEAISHPRPSQNYYVFLTIPWLWARSWQWIGGNAFVTFWYILNLLCLSSFCYCCLW